MEPVIFEPIGEHSSTFIFAHGLGDNALMWAMPIELWRRNGLVDNVKFVLPNAPTIPFTAVRVSTLP